MDPGFRFVAPPYPAGAGVKAPTTEWSSQRPPATSEEKWLKPCALSSLPRRHRKWPRNWKLVQEQIQAHCAEGVVRWTRAGQFHLTLRFLGTIPGDGLPELELALQRACQGNPSPHVQVERLGCFPQANRPRVLWVGFSGDVAPLVRLAASDCRRNTRFGRAAGGSFLPPAPHIGPSQQGRFRPGTAPSRSGASNH